MANYIVWTDRQNAKVFKMNEGGNGHALHWAPPVSPTHGRDATERESEAFYHQVAEQLRDARAILIIGPGVGKTHFKHHLDKHDPKIGARVLAVESADHPSDGQIKAVARKFFDNPLNVPHA